MAKSSPIEFVRQVRAETRKVVWPSWNETWRTALMVALMAGTLGVFFFVTDAVFDRIVLGLLALAK